MPPVSALSDEDLDRLLAADQHLAAALERADPFFEDDELEPVRRVMNDLAIRIVEGRYQPESVAQIRALRQSPPRQPRLPGPVPDCSPRVLTGGKRLTYQSQA